MRFAVCYILKSCNLSLGIILALPQSCSLGLCLLTQANNPHLLVWTDTGVATGEGRIGASERGFGDHLGDDEDLYLLRNDDGDRVIASVTLAEMPGDSGGMHTLRLLCSVECGEEIGADDMGSD
ncbi:hypothetical protein Tco_1430056 [Tanacetum coccineum]